MGVGNILCLSMPCEYFEGELRIPFIKTVWKKSRFGQVRDCPEVVKVEQGLGNVRLEFRRQVTSD